jgi:hypothetical protein
MTIGLSLVATDSATAGADGLSVASSETISTRPSNQPSGAFQYRQCPAAGNNRASRSSSWSPIRPDAAIVSMARRVSPPPISGQQERSSSGRTLLGLVVLAEQEHRLERVRAVSIHRREEHQLSVELVNAVGVAEHEHLVQRRPLVGPHWPSLPAAPRLQVDPRSEPETGRSLP